MSGESDSEPFRTVFVGQLHNEITEESLKSHFEEWGEIDECVVLRDPNTKISKGCGFVKYKRAYMAEQAVAATHKLHGENVVTVITDRYERKHIRTLFVGGLNNSHDEESLKTHFRKWGEIVECTLVRNRSGESRGFGFITYKRASMVDDAQAARPHKINGEKVDTKRSFPKDNSVTEANMSVKTLYIRGIKNDLGEEDLREYFGRYGNIVNVNIRVDKNTGKTIGSAFVEFDDYDPVDKIVLQRHNLKDNMLSVDKAHSRETITSNRQMKLFRRSGGAYEFETGNCFNGGYGSDRGRGNMSYGSAEGYSGYRGYGYCSRYSGVWGHGYSDRYSGGWSSGYNSNYGNVHMLENTGYAQQSRGHYGGRRLSGRYGRL